tara:strand:+ start:300 stop:416 length:117 start_codon:yes stop_codon:yes gene_type:complete
MFDLPYTPKNAKEDANIGLEDARIYVFKPSVATFEIGF